MGPRVALSDMNGIATFYEAGNSVSSSLLAMAKLHEDAAPGSAVAQSIDVKTAKLDDLLGSLSIGVSEPTMLKIDVQGAERLVLAGAQKALENQVIGIKLEMSIAPLYRGQAEWLELHRYLEDKEFHLWDIEPGFRDYRSGRLLQFDGLYFRERTG